MSVTPESDSNVLSITCSDDCCTIYVTDKKGIEIEDDVVSINLSRKLETERNDAKEALNRIAELYERYQYDSCYNIINVAYDMRCIARTALLIDKRDKK